MADVVEITAPFTPAQVDALNRWQRLGYVHEFTCREMHEGFNRALVATARGWICPHCDYTQNWALSSMLDRPPNPLPDPVEVFITEVASIDEVKASRMIMTIDPRGLLTALIERAKELRKRYVS